MHRGWMSHPAFKDVLYTEREAWLWLIENSAYEDTTVSLKGHPMRVSRGSLSYSLRYLAKAWGWNDPERVRRYLSRLEQWGMIAVRSATRQNIITICNYEKYQSPVSSFVSETRRKAHGQHDDDTSSPMTNKKEQNEGKEPKEISPIATELPEWVPVQEFTAYADFRKSIKRPIKTAHALRLTIEKLVELRLAGHDPASVLNQSIANGWTGLFPLKPSGHTPPHLNKQSHSQKMLEATIRGAQAAMKKSEEVE